jgi:hypothetical protein
MVPFSRLSTPDESAITALAEFLFRAIVEAGDQGRRRGGLVRFRGGEKALDLLLAAGRIEGRRERHHLGGTSIVYHVRSEP